MTARPILPGLLLALGVVATLWASPAAAQSTIEGEVRALLADGAYERAERLAQASVDAPSASTGASAERHRLRSWLVTARLRNGKAAQSSTLALARELFDASSADGAVDAAQRTRDAVNLGDALVGAAQYEQATSVLQQAADGAAAAGLDAATTGGALDHLALSFILRDRPDDALRVAGQALVLKRAALPARDTAVADTLYGQAWALQRKGDYAAAGVALREAVSIREANSPHHPAYADALSLLGLQLWFEGRVRASLDVSKDAVRVAEETLPGAHPTTALALKRLGGTLLDLGDASAALEAKRRALGIAEQVFGAEHYETWAYLNDLAEGLRKGGDFANARALYARALTIARARFGPAHDSVATALHNLALTDASLGDDQGSRQEQLEAEAIWEKVLGADHPFVAVALTELADVYRGQGQYLTAQRHLRRALAIEEERLGPTHRAVARTLISLGEVYRLQRQLTLADRTSVRALALLEGADGVPVLELAAVHRLRAAVAADRAEWRQARDNYESALGVMVPSLGDTHPAVADARVGLASVLARLGDSSGATRLAADAENSGRAHLRLMLGFLPERQALDYAAHRPEGLDLLVSLAPTTSAGPSVAFDTLIRSRALVLDEMGTRRKVAAREPAAAELRGELAAARQRLANLVLWSRGDVPSADEGARQQAARAEVEALEVRLAGQSAPFRDELSRASLGLRDVALALPGDAALVALVQYVGTARSLDGGTRNGAGRSYGAFVLMGGEAAPAFVALGSAARLDALIEQWRQALLPTDTDATRATGAMLSARVTGAALARALWKPIAARLGPVPRVFVVPDGAVNLVPFAALPAATGRYLLEDGPVFHYLSAERDLVVEPRAETGRGVGLLALGNAAYGAAAAVPRAGRPVNSAAANASARGAAQPGCPTFDALRFVPLPGTGREAEAVTAIWARSDTEAHGDGTLLTGDDASEAAIKRLGPGREVLHIATHGFFLAGDCADRVTGTRSVGTVVPLQAAPRRPRAEQAGRPRSPLLRAGLALAGANRRLTRASEGDDGILTAEEVAGLDLSGVRWAVLSACDTGLGQVTASDGVLGMRRAFQLAGARTVIMSLWAVEDRATRVWMQALYQARLDQHVDTPTALREASLSVLESRRRQGLSTSPFFWAGFVAAGEWE